MRKKELEQVKAAMKAQMLYFLTDWKSNIKYLDILQADVVARIDNHFEKYLKAELKKKG